MHWATSRREAVRGVMQASPILHPERIRELIATPHDALFRALISNAARADALIRENFPGPLMHHLNGGPARPGFVGQVDPLLRQSYPDGVFEFGGSPGEPGAVVILEHLHTVRRDVVRRLAEYTLGVQRHWIQQGAEPMVVPMLVTADSRHGRETWLRGWDEFGPLLMWRDPIGIAGHWLGIGELPYTALSSTPVVLGVLGAFQCARVEPAPVNTLVKVFRDLAVLPRSSALWGVTYVYGLLMFELELADYHALIRETDPREREAEMATMFQQQMAERDQLRREEGREEGRAEGRADLLLRLAGRRFGPVSTDAEARIRTAPASNVDPWVDAIFDARSLDDLFDRGRSS